MLIIWGGFGGKGIINSEEKEEIYQLDKRIDEELAYGKRIMADLTECERKALPAYQKMLECECN